MDFTINFNSIFNCFRRAKQDIRQDLTLLKRSLSNHPIDIQISLLLQKAVNGRFESGYIFKIINEKDFAILDYYGKLNHLDDRLYTARNFPIMIDGTIKFILCVRGKLGTAISISDELIELLKSVLILV